MALGSTNSVSLASLQGFFISQLFGSAQTLQASGMSPLALSASALAVANLNTQFQSSVATALQSLFDSAQALNTAARGLVASSSGNQFEKRTATSSNTSVLTATAANQATATTYTFTVSQLAVAQKNLGTALTSSSTHGGGLSNGTNQFRITVNGTNYDGSVSVGSGDTNQTFLNNFATAINNLNAGVTATVVNDATAGTSRIQIVANKTGTSSAFTISDRSGGKAVNYSNADTVLTSAQNASYTVNSVPYTAETNSVVLDSGKVTATLVGTSASNVTLTVGNDTTTIKSAISDFVEKFNSFVTTLATNAPYLTTSLAANVTRAVDLVRFDLASSGISVNANGTLRAVDERLASALSNNFSKVSSAIGGFKGLATQLKSQTDTIVASPIGKYAANLPTFSPYNSIAPFIAQSSTTSFLNLLASGLFVNQLA